MKTKLLLLPLTVLQLLGLSGQIPAHEIAGLKKKVSEATSICRI